MGLFSKRPSVPLTEGERRGEWTRAELMQHWRTIPENQKLMALTHATDDQLRVMAWEFPDSADRFIAICEAKQRRALPELRAKIEAYVRDDDTDAEEVTEEDFKRWIAPVLESHGRKLPKEELDREYGQLFPLPK